MTSRPAPAADAEIAPVESVVALTRELIAIPSRGGEDPCQPIIEHVAKWLRDRGVAINVLNSPVGDPVAVVAELPGGTEGPTYCLDACLDTAPFGELAAWDKSPTDPHIANGWLYGRGAADSKVAVAIFSHLAAQFSRCREELAGRLLVLFDADEHTGHFTGVKTFVRQFPDVDGVMIGYPGNFGVLVGARGFYRATVTLHGVGGHSGGRKSGSQNAIEKAARFVDELRSRPLPAPTDAFPLAPSVTVTGITGGSSFSMVPDRCDVSVDLRLTPSFDTAAGQALLKDAAEHVDKILSGRAPASLQDTESWPAYRLPDSARVVRALLDAARTHHDPQIQSVVCGPSNVGNYSAAQRIEATCGFGVTYENIHAPNERVRLDTIPMAYAVYSEAISSLLAGSRRAPE